MVAGHLWGMQTHGHRIPFLQNKISPGASQHDVTGKSKAFDMPKEFVMSAQRHVFCAQEQIPVHSCLFELAGESLRTGTAFLHLVI